MNDKYLPFILIPMGMVGLALHIPFSGFVMGAGLLWVFYRFMTSAGDY